jgi:nicotinamide phosphoribosyltransferase
MLVRGDSGDCVKVVTETVFHLWNIFGGTINSKGYRVLNPHIKALYGDSITVQRAEQIYEILEKNGFAASNVSLGVGSFSMHCIEEDGMLKPFTRDTFSMAIKAVYAEFTDENGNVTKMPVYKDPKTDREAGGGNFKKSQKGCVVVSKNNDGSYTFTDGYNWDETDNEYNALRPIFRDGKMVVDDDLATIRQRLNGGKF